MKKTLFAAYRLTRLNEHFGNSIVATAMGALFNPNLRSANLFLWILCINILGGIFNFAINDIEDAEDDAKDPKKVKRNPISAKDLSKPLAWILTWSTALIALLLALPLGTLVTSLVVLTLVLGFLYSYKGFRLKSMPFVDIFSHGLFLGSLPYLIALLAVNGSLHLTGAVIGILIFVTSAIGDIDNEIRDYKVDREQKIHNTASVIDLRPMEPFVHVLHSICAVTILVTIFKTISLAGVLIFAFGGVVIAIRYISLKESERTKFYYSVSQLLLAGVGGLLMIDKWLPAVHLW